ncbi:MAG: ABC transporter ATP-binding protein [Chloroflexi bacterium]|nr:ABC transporter ATP-binding protein [Chloroflexota bacterium]
MALKAEFSVQAAYPFDRRGPLLWIWSHVWRYKWLFLFCMGGFAIGYFTFSYARVLIGQAAEAIINPAGGVSLVNISLSIFLILVFQAGIELASSLSIQTVAQRLERDGRQEVYEALLGKSQTWHDRQRVGDIMARTTDDMQTLNGMINPGILFMLDMGLGLTVPIFLIATIEVELLALIAIFIPIYILTVRRYARTLNPVVNAQRGAFGALNASLEETISGIEVVKASAQETFERAKFRRNAKAFRDFYAQQGRIEARYLPMLFYAILTGGVFLHCMLLYAVGRVNIADIIGVMGLVNVMSFPVFVSIWAFSLLQLGVASARRILDIINAETALDENASGYSAPIKGAIAFEDVTFTFEDGIPILQNISFNVEPGQTVAIVGQTGSGKSTLTDLINRTYDVTGGRILIDGVDVREWNLAPLRSQISRIEQDVFLFSRSISENIAFGAPGTPQEEIERAGREAQAHDFIMSFNEGYKTVIGERGVTLSGGQRQRLALARAFLSEPRILILDDSTSAIDSATEDEIQKAINRAQQGRTTLLITHRLSQIRWADHILVLDQGKLLASGTHEELLRTSAIYRRIFARYDAPLPPLEPVAETAAAD